MEPLVGYWEGLNHCETRKLKIQKNLLVCNPIPYSESRTLHSFSHFIFSFCQ